MEINQTQVIITGGASGMGAATARFLSAQGAKVAIFDRNLAEAEKVAAEIKGRAFACDVSDPLAIEASFKAMEAEWGPARICINCAGILLAKRLINETYEDFRQVIQINLLGTFYTMRLAAQAMMNLEPLGESGERGVIINTASIAAYEGQIGQTAYSASKGGIISMTLPAARELGPWGIRVMTIAPGLVDTPLFAKLTPEVRASLAQAVPFPKRLAFPEEYARLALHIIENPMLNGEVIRLDGALRMAAK